MVHWLWFCLLTRADHYMSVSLASLLKSFGKVRVSRGSSIYTTKQADVKTGTLHPRQASCWTFSALYWFKGKDKCFNDKVLVFLSPQCTQYEKKKAGGVCRLVKVYFPRPWIQSPRRKRWKAAIMWLLVALTKWKWFFINKKAPFPLGPWQWRT